MYTVRPLKIRLKTSSDPLDLFVSESTRTSCGSRDVLFYRVIGVDCSGEEYLKRIERLDAAAQKLPSAYMRLNRLEKPGTADVAKYQAACGEWLGAGALSDCVRLQLPITFSVETLEWSAKRAFFMLLEAYGRTSGATETKLKNYALKMLHWMERCLKHAFEGGYFPKIVFSGEIMEQESLFLLFCSRIGCDVLYISPSADFPLGVQELYARSRLLESGVKMKGISIPEYSGDAAKVTNGIVNTSHGVMNTKHSIAKAAQGRILSYEELAGYSSSVVMIDAYSAQKERLHSGSGVVINEKGMILTNMHVVEGGAYFGIRFENEENYYLTDTLIKCHGDFDLAVIRVDRTARPLRILAENTLRRGQKVVAIGSPMGLFNSVSDGIISGFREIGKMEMIQFTAPASGGSSGGALMDMRANLIGIIEGGVGQGLNLNFAVGLRTVYNFVQAFL